MKGASWIAWRELWTRPWSTLLAVGTVALAVAVCAATELVHQAREVAVSADIDAMGPALRLLPAGRTSRDLVRFDLGETALPEELAPEIAGDLRRSVRTAEGRLNLVLPVDGRETPVIGVDPGAISGREPLESGRVLLGKELAAQLHKEAGDDVRLDGRTLSVAAVLPSTASAEDLALTMTLRDLQRATGLSGAVNEVRVFLVPGTEPRDVAAELRRRYPDTTVTLPDNDDATRASVERSLSGLRWVIYLVTASVAAFCILIWSSLNANERRVEMATLVAIGGTGSTVFWALCLRAGMIALAGAVLGNALAVGIVLAQDYSAARSVVGLSAPLLTLLGASLVVALAGAVPATLRSALREHVQDLQV